MPLRARIRGLALPCLALLGATALSPGVPPAGAAAPPGFRVRAIGDSVTSGFGYCGTADAGCGAAQDQLMGISHLIHCATGARDNRCSSNFGNPSGAGSSVSWALQFARREGVADFSNTAVQGSTPEDWNAGGQENGRLAQVVADDPDLTLMTLGANPILHDYYAGSGVPCLLLHHEAAVRTCVRASVLQYAVVPRLEAIYAALLSAPRNHIVVFQYHTPVPIAAAGLALRSKIAAMMEEINAGVAQAVAQTAQRHPGRITLLSPDGSPWAAAHQCPDVQAVMIAEWRVSLGHVGLDPHHSSTPWVLSGDGCIHPTMAGYEQFANPLVRWFDAQAHPVRTAGIRAAPPATTATPTGQLLDVAYDAVQVGPQRPRVRIRLSMPARVSATIFPDRCLRLEVTRPAACEHGRVGGSRAVARIAFRGHPGWQTISLPVGRGFYDFDVSATTDTGATEADPVQLIYESTHALIGLFGGRRPR